MNIEQAIDYAQSEISQEDSLVDAKYLLSHLLNRNFTWLKTWQDNELTNNEEEGFKQLVARRKNGEPIAYITSEKDFWSLTLEANPSTLIPRPETELLVEKALNFLSDKSKANVLDLGTGTGAIALAIASERKNDSITACDFVEDAVFLAKINAEKNEIANVNIIQSNWYSNINQTNFDLIVSNPPYVEEDDPHLQQGDLRFEPKSALVSSNNGLADIKIIIEQSKQHLNKGGALMIEHGYQQATEIQKIFLQYDYQEIATFQDLAGLDRITIGFFLK